MSSIRVPKLRAATLLRRMFSGRTMPCLMLCTDDDGNNREAVLKWRGNKEIRARGLICELMTALLAQDFDLPVPQPFVVEVASGFWVGEENSQLAQIAKESSGLNFGSEKLPAGAATWPKDKLVPMPLRPLAAEIFAFDVIVQNPDRRRENPNLLWLGDEIFICDHEQAFSFVMGVIGWKPPWTGHGTDFFQKHVFYEQLSGGSHNLERLSGALEALTDARIKEYIEAVPHEWRAESDAGLKIAEYLRNARQDRTKLFTVINQLLK